MRPIGYGAMLTESFVAVMAMIAAVTLDPGVYFAMNANPALLGDTVQSASQAVNGFGFSVSPEALQGTADAVGENLSSEGPAARRRSQSAYPRFSPASAARPCRRSGTTSP